MDSREALTTLADGRLWTIPAVRYIPARYGRLHFTRTSFTCRACAGQGQGGPARGRLDHRSISRARRAAAEPAIPFADRFAISAAPGGGEENRPGTVKAVDQHRKHAAHA